MATTAEKTAAYKNNSTITAPAGCARLPQQAGHVSPCRPPCRLFHLAAAFSLRARIRPKRNRREEPALAEMPRYFFNLAPGLPIDEEGEELPDDDAAKELGRQTALEIVRDGPPTVPGERLVVSNEKGEMVDEIYLDSQDGPEEGSK